MAGNLELALSGETHPGAPRKLSGKETALLVATACSSPPEGRKRWTLDLLAGAMVRLTEHDGLSRETVRRRLAEDDLKPWRRNSDASRRSTVAMSPGWRMFSTLEPVLGPAKGRTRGPKNLIHHIRWFASTKAPRS